MENNNLKLAFSTCPNDTFMFHALVSGIIKTDYNFEISLTDIEDLNNMALKKENDITKVSFSALSGVLDDYVLLRSGAALGRGCGPMVVSLNSDNIKNLENKKIAVPGMNTTAALLIRLYAGSDLNLIPMPFYEIMPAVREKKADLGVIIHEGRFTYKNYNLVSCLDLGQWWEDTTGLPIPLGGIAAKRNLGSEVIKHIQTALSESVLYAFKNPEVSSEYITKYAQEMEEDVIKEHIELYVNEFSVKLGKEGENAVYELFKRSEKAGIINSWPENGIFG